MGTRSDLIFDVGLHRGEDTDYYLKKGFRVVAFEANPDLVAYCTKRFSEEIGDGRLTIVEGAITGGRAGEQVSFFINDVNSTWGTIDASRATLNEGYGASSHKIEVNVIEMTPAFEAYGMPYYLKVDIESADDFVLGQLKLQSDRPQYISVETSKVDFSEVQRTLSMLVTLGYRRFKAVEQGWIPGSEIVTSRLDGTELKYKFEEGASGRFGGDLHEGWLDYQHCLAAYRKIFWKYRNIAENRFLPRLPKGANLARLIFGRSGWHDLHASL